MVSATLEMRVQMSHSEMRVKGPGCGGLPVRTSHTTPGPEGAGAMAEEPHRTF